MHRTKPRQSVRKKIGDISMRITPEKRGCDHAVTSFKTPVIARHPIREKSRKPGSRSLKKTVSQSHTQSRAKRKSGERSSHSSRRLQFLINTRPPPLQNYCNGMCYINAGLQSLSGSEVISNCARLTANTGKPMLLIKALFSVSRNSRDESNTRILQCINEDKDLRSEFKITGHLIPDVKDDLKMPHQSADVLAEMCLHRMIQTGCVLPKDLCRYTTCLTCFKCGNTHGQEQSPVISVTAGSNVGDYIHGFPYTTRMDNDNKVHCHKCREKTSHIKTEDLCTRISSTVVVVCNRQENTYTDLKVPELLQMQDHDVNTHRIVGTTIHKPGHFVSLRKCDSRWYMCNDNRVTGLPQQGNLKFYDNVYTFTNGRLPLRLVSIHGTMIVYEKIIDL